MKKLLLALFVLPTLVFGQTLVNFNKLSNWTPTPSGYGNYSYVDANIPSFSCSMTNVFRENEVSRMIDSSGIRFRNADGTMAKFTIATGGVSTFSFDARSWNPSLNYVVEYKVGNNEIQSAGVLNNISSAVNNYSYTINTPNNQPVVITVRRTSGERLILDNFTWTTSPAATTCTISAAGLTGVTCDNAGTATVDTDDNIKFSLNPTAQLNATAYNVTVPAGYTVSPATANYGSATEFTLVKTDANAAGSGNVIATITDATDATCTLDVTITDPGVCSFTVPTLITSTATVTIPNYVLPFNSPVRSFTFSGQILEGNVTVTAPANFEISKNNVTYGSTLVFIAGEHTEMTDSIVYVRSIATTVGTQAGTITISTPNVDQTTTATVTVSTQITGQYVATTFPAIKANTEGGQSVLLNQKVAVTGVTACTNLHASRYNFYILDENEEGLYIFRNNFFTSYTFNSGDRLTVYGTIAAYNGLTQVVADSIVVVETGVVLDLTPTLVETITEANESNYIMMEGVRFETRPASGVWPTGNVVLKKGEYTFTYRVQSQTGLNGQAIPQSETFTVKGFASQYSETAPFNTGYQLYPCSASDVIPGEIIVCESPVTGAVTYDAETATITATEEGENLSYQWLFCGDNAPDIREILFQTASTFTATIDGSFQVRISNTAPGCSPVLSECIEVTIDNTSVKGILAASTQIFPNPFNTALTIVSEKAVSFSVTDIQGKTVEVTQAIAGKASINTQSWLQGVYFIQLVGDNGDSHTVKVVK